MRHYIKLRFFSTQRKEWWVRIHKCILNSFKFLANNFNILFGHIIYFFICTWWWFFNVHMQINEIATYTSCKLKYTLIPGLVNRACVCVCECYISSIFFNVDNKHYFYDKRFFIGFIKSSPSARLYLEVLVTTVWLNLKTVCIDSLLSYISFCFLLALWVQFSYRT